MSVDFFLSPCGNLNGHCNTGGVCKTTSSSSKFGVCDRNNEPNKPAFINDDLEQQDTLWDLDIMNPNNKEVTFKAIDYCLEVFRTGNELIQRCEGFLYYDNKIIFIEIKKRRYRGWLTLAREQIEETILKFKEVHPDCALEIQEPVIANKIRPQTHQNLAIQQKMLKDKIGLIFKLQSSITIT